MNVIFEVAIVIRPVNGEWRNGINANIHNLARIPTGLKGWIISH